METDRLQLELLVKFGYVAPEVASAAFSHAERRSFKDFCAFLVQYGALSTAKAEEVRARVFRYVQGAGANGGLHQEEPRTLADIEHSLSKLRSQNRLLCIHGRSQYRSVEKLGEGGMGVVYRIEDEKLRRTAALKTVNSVAVNSLEISRFIREARITASLDHPNIPPVYELGMNSSGEHYMLMKVIEGQSLKAAIAEVHGSGSADHKEVRRLLEVLVKVCEAMAYAHSKEVIHRDLKPENIMIGEFGEVMVLDWGLARDFCDKKEEKLTGPDSELSLQLRAAAQKEGLTGAGDLLGTVGYMAPEQVDGEACKQSDVFALGAILTEILTGKKAIAGDSVISKLSATIHGRVYVPRHFDRSASKELDSLAVRSLEMELITRLKSVADFSADLKAYLLGEELECYHYNWFERSQRWISRHPTILSSAISVGLLVISSVYFQSALALAERGRIESEQGSDEAVNRKERLETCLRLFEEAEGAARRQSFTSVEENKLGEALRLGGRTEANLLKAAAIYKTVRRKRLSRDLLIESVQRFAPAYESLYQLHLLESESLDLNDDSEYLKQLLHNSKVEDRENRFVLIARLSEAIRRSKWEDVLALSELCETDLNSNSSFFYHRGFAKYSLGQFEGALNDFVRAGKLKPESPKFKLHIGLALEEMGRLRLAEQMYGVAITLDAVNIDAWVARAKVKRRNRDFPASVLDWREVISLNPQFVLAHEMLVADLLSLKKNKEALQAANDGVAKNPKSSKLYWVRGNIHVSNRSLKKALVDYEQAYRLDPDSDRYLFSLGGSYYSVGNFAEAEAIFKKLCKRSPKSAQGLFMLGRVRFERGFRKEGLALVNRAISMDPKVEIFYFIRGYYFTQLKDDKAAIQDFTKALSINIGNGRSYYSRALAFERERMYKESALDFEQFLKYQPKHKISEGKRAFIMKHLGRPSKY